MSGVMRIWGRKRGYCEVVLSFKGSLARSCSGSLDVRQGFRSCERLTGMRCLAVDPPRPVITDYSFASDTVTSSPSFLTREVDRRTPSHTEKLLAMVERGVLWYVARVYYTRPIDQTRTMERIEAEVFLWDDGTM